MFLEIGRLRGSIDTTSPPNLTQGQYLRLPATEESSLEAVERLCALANDSQSFYRSASLKQWLRTVVSLDGLIIHSNVVARDAYLDPSSCLDPDRCRGFSHVSELELTNRSCWNCALAEQMRAEAGDHHMADADQNSTLLEIEDQAVHDVQDLAQGVVHKIVWRCGTFVRKRFNSRGIFERELEVAAEVSHPNIVHCFGWSWLGLDNSESDDSESDEEIWSFDLFMECLDVDLQRFLSEEGDQPGGAFSFRDALNVLQQVAEAMKYLHEKRFVHGDLKSQNIFLSPVELAHTEVQRYLVKVGDFGCTQRVDAPFCADIGTLHYSAPEVFKCRFQNAPPPQDPQKIDVFSFGVVAFQVLTGVVNLYVDLHRSRDVAAAVLQGRRPSDPEFQVDHLDGHQASWMLTFVKQCWAEKPEDRPSFSQICDELNSKRSSDKHGLRANIAKRKQHDSVGEVPTIFLKLAKSACEQALNDRNETRLET